MWASGWTRASFTKEYKWRQSHSNRTTRQSLDKRLRGSLKLSNNLWVQHIWASSKRETGVWEKAEPRYHQKVQWRINGGGVCFHIGMSCTDPRIIFKLFYITTSETDLSVLNWLYTLHCSTTTHIAHITRTHTKNPTKSRTWKCLYFHSSCNGI